MKVGGDVTPASLRQYGIKTLVLSESCVFTQKDKQKATMDLLYNDEIKLGKIFGKRAEAEALVEDWKQQLQALPQRPADTQPRKVFVYDSGEDKPFTSGKYAMPTAIIEAAGGKKRDGIAGDELGHHLLGERGGHAAGFYYLAGLSDRQWGRGTAPLPGKSSAYEADACGEAPPLPEVTVR